MDKNQTILLLEFTDARKDCLTSLLIIEKMNVFTRYV